MSITLALIVSVAATAVDAPTPEALRAQADRCDRLLKTGLVTFYLPAAVDRDHGGYLETYRDGRFVATGEKFLVMQARQLWFFSTLAIEGIERDRSLQAARSGYDFLEAKMRDRRHGGYFAKVSDSGEPIDRRKHVYLNAFAIFALVAYHRASGDASALDAARSLFRTLDDRAHDRARGGYVEFFEADWREVTDPKAAGFVGAIGVKTYNTHLHVLEALTALLRAWPDPTVRARLEEAVAINTGTVRHPSVACNIDAWHPDWRIVDTPANLRASYGHDIECAWLVLDAVEALGRPAAVHRSWADALCRNSLGFGFDRAHGGFYYSGPPGLPADLTRKEWWVQAEALPAMLTMYATTRDPAYHVAFAKTLDFIEAHQVAPGGGWYYNVQADGSPADRHLSGPWQGAYHSGRALIVSRKLLGSLSGPR